LLGFLVSFSSFPGAAVFYDTEPLDDDLVQHVGLLSPVAQSVGQLSQIGQGVSIPLRGPGEAG
jgi:hypothetical protein